MAALQSSHEEGVRLIKDQCDQNDLHQATVYSGMVICGVDGLQQLALWLMEEPLVGGLLSAKSTDAITDQEPSRST